MRIGTLILSIGLLATLACAQATQPATQPSAAAVGQPAPAFTLVDQNGQPHALSDFAGKIVVLEWFNDQCPYVKKHYNQGHMNRLAEKYIARGVVWLAIDSSHFSTVEQNKQIAQEWKINRPLLDDSAGQVGTSYGARTTPHLFIIDSAGRLAYAGAIDSVNDTKTESIDGATNYAAKALDELLAGQPVSHAQTKPYGCSVKYK